MDVPQARRRIWSPQIIVFSIVFHAVILYYIATTLNIVPPILPTSDEPRTIPTVYIPPQNPELPKPDEIKDRPRFLPRQPIAPPVTPPVKPLTIPAQTPQTGEPTVVAINTPIPEQPVSQVLPNYPRTAQERDVEGRVVLSITIMPDGSVRDVRVVSAQPRGYFEESALRAVRTWRYRPSNMIRTNVVVDIDFVLQG